MHSSRMRTACSLTIVGGVGVCLPKGGVPAWGSVCPAGVCLGGGVACQVGCLPGWVSAGGGGGVM